MSATPWVRAHRAIASTDSPPSIGSAAALSSSVVPIEFHFSGSTITSAPVDAACATSRSAVSRFTALSARLVICTHATRIRSGTAKRIPSSLFLSGGAGVGFRPCPCTGSRARRRARRASARGRGAQPRARRRSHEHADRAWSRVYARGCTGTPESPALGLRKEVRVSYGLLLLRVVVGGTMFSHGAQKLFGWFGGHGPRGTAGFFGRLGYRVPLLMAVLAGIG